MPSPGFFSSLGLFLRHGFLDPALCARLRSEMRAASSEKASVVRKGSDAVDESIRKVLCASLEESTALLVGERLLELEPRLEQHFGVSLTGCDGPQFLMYSDGAFYGPHRDKGGSPELAKRQVSIVVFLNAQSEEPAADCYGGGSLTFHGLLEGPEWENCAFPLEAEPGLLIAFSSGTLHEVKPVTFGERFTVVAWFLGGGETGDQLSTNVEREAGVRSMAKESSQEGSPKGARPNR